MKKLYFLSTVLLSVALLALSSCLKDNRYIAFNKVGTIVEMPYSGLAYFASFDAITATPDSDANGTINVKFAVIVASPTPPKTATTVTLTVDTTLVASYDAANPAIQYVPVPSNAYVLNKVTVTIPAGQTVVVDSVTFYKNKLSPSVSYMLPLKIASNSGNYPISSNMGIHYYHFIGNPLAGNYNHTLLRYNGFTTMPPAGTTPSGGSFTTPAPATFSPVNPNEITVNTGYYTQLVKYHFTFDYSNGVYSNPAVTLDAADVAADYTPNGISVTQQPVVVSADFVNKVFVFQYVATTSGGPRYLIDTYSLH